jgi:hypothetical protein
MIAERLSRLLGTFEITEEPETANDLTWDEVRAAGERHRRTPPGAKSSLDLLREDRDS